MLKPVPHVGQFARCQDFDWQEEAGRCPGLVEDAMRPHHPKALCLGTSLPRRGIASMIQGRFLGEGNLEVHSGTLLYTKPLPPKTDPPK